jgi:hypothetical protein
VSQPCESSQCRRGEALWLRVSRCVYAHTRMIGRQRLPHFSRIIERKSCRAGGRECEGGGRCQGHSKHEWRQQRLTSGSQARPRQQSGVNAGGQSAQRNLRRHNETNPGVTDSTIEMASASMASLRARTNVYTVSSPSVSPSVSHSVSQLVSQPGRQTGRQTDRMTD